MGRAIRRIRRFVLDIGWGYGIIPPYDKPLMTPPPATSPANLIGKHLRVADILNLLPEAEELFAQNGLHCGGCGVGGAETLEQAADMHGMDEADLADLLTDLNILLSRRPDRPETIDITEEGAKALASVLAAEGKTGHVLRVGLDEAGSFSMDIVPSAPEHDLTFDQYGLTVSAAPLTLKAIGGSTVDFRDGRFKLDLPSSGVIHQCACKNGGECGCA